MINTTTIQKCAACSDNNCMFTDYRGKRDLITGFYIAHIDKENIDSCTIYLGFCNLK